VESLAQDSRADSTAVAIARAIVTDQTSFSPRAHRQPGFRNEPRDHALLTALNDERGITIIMVTHEREMARFARRTVNFRDGRIDSAGQVQEMAE
jgi:putative ABC transport system ATP-binding protein